MLALLFGAMQLVLPLGTPGYGSEWLLTFGFLILAAYSVGELVTPLRLPKITGYLVAGIIFGPSLLGTVSVDAVRSLSPVSSLAIGLIAYLAGAELRWEEVRRRGPTIARILVSEMGLTFVLLTALLVTLGDRLPFMEPGITIRNLAFALLFAGIAVVHSPAVVMALISETKANGPVARTTLGIVLVSDVVVVIVFSAVLAIVRGIVPPTGSEGGGLGFGTLVWEICGAVAVGALLGGAVALYLRFVRRELLLFAVVIVFLGMVIAQLAHVETLLTLLTAGFVTENLSRREHGTALRHAMERSAAPVFVVFFALAGAQVALKDVFAVWPLLLPLVAVRIAGIWAGTALGARWAGAGREGKAVWLGLVSQAGVAIGLANTVAQAYPTRGAEIRTIFLAVVALNQIIGPVLFRYALARNGEVLSGRLGEETPVHAREPLP